ncbi:MAG: class I SAM-dependent methyltransferase [Actinomycetota bacterium]
MSQTWEDEAENWVKWVRTPGHDIFRIYSGTFYGEVLPRSFGPTLEVGCGEGRVCRDLKERGYDIVGTDPSPTLVRHARRSDPDGNYLVAPGEQLPFGDAGFDLVVAYNSLQNVDDLQKTAAELARVLAPGGHLCACIAHPMTDAGRFQSREPDAPFVIKDSYYGPRRLDERVERDGLEITFHGWMYSLEEYTLALEENGFVIELIREPRPSEEAVAERPALAQWRRLPLFMFFRARKR